MTDTRALAGGICLALGGAPLVVYYGASPFGFVGLVLVSAGLLISVGASRVD